MLKEMSLSSTGVLFLNAPVACSDGAPDLVCGPAVDIPSRVPAKRVRASKASAFDAIRTLERVGLAAIQVGAIAVVAAGIASLMA